MNPTSVVPSEARPIHTTRESAVFIQVSAHKQPRWLLSQRRTMMAAMLASVMLSAPWWCEHQAWGQSGPEAIGLVRTASEKLVQIVNANISPEEKRRQLGEVIEASVDVEDIARFCLGRFWKAATPLQQQQYQVLFRDVLADEIAGHLGDYQGVTVQIGSVEPSSGIQIVNTTVNRPHNPPSQVEWVVSTTTGTPKIIDLMASGTSMRLTHSADFTAYLTHHNYDVHELIEAMNHQVAQRR